MRNVRDKFANMTEDEIKDSIRLPDYRPHFEVAMTHTEGDFNLGCVFRTANGFSADKAIYVGGSKSWDRRSAVGTHHYMDIEYYREEEEFISYLKNCGKIPMVFQLLS
jgi:tRNA G18 (ribose-2'-O)-methylase SpoU